MRLQNGSRRELCELRGGLRRAPLEVPPRYNIAADVCDSIRATRGNGPESSMVDPGVHWGELQDLANQAAYTLADRGIGRGDRVAVVLPATPETAALFFGVWKLGAILLSMSVLYGEEAIDHRLSDSEAKLLVTDPGDAPRFERPSLERLVLSSRTHSARPRPTPSAPTRRPTIPPSSTTRPARLGWRRDRPRSPLHPRSRGVPLPPRGRRRGALPRHGRVGLGSWDRAVARAVAVRRDAVCLSARGRLRPPEAARLPQPPPDHRTSSRRRRRCGR